MRVPLYKDHRAPESLPSNAHTGLWFDKFFNRWPTSEWSLKSSGDKNPKFEWIRIIAVPGKPVGDAKLLEEHSARLATLARAQGGQALYFKTSGRFATGLGREHPIENGFVWHQAIGTPCLPGSSVKGLIRAWATWTQDDKEAVTRIFGPRGSEAARTGSVLFFDAIPTRPVQLAADVMTPHHGPYYEDTSGKTAPGDWHSPVPIPFLTVSSGQSFIFALAPRTLSDSDRADCRKAAEWLNSALRELGAGAKTAVGYGRFEPDHETEKEFQEQRRIAGEQAAREARLSQMTPIMRELENAIIDGNWDGDKNAFSKEGIIESWLVKLESTADIGATSRLRELVNIHFPGLLANPNKTSGKKNQPVFKSRQQKFAHRMNSLLKGVPDKPIV